MSLLEAAKNINTDWRDLLIKILQLNLTTIHFLINQNIFTPIKYL